MNKTLKKIPWNGWSKQKPNNRQKVRMLNKCGKKCFLGKNKSFPICKKYTCKISKKGVYAAYVRANQFLHKGKKYAAISKKAHKYLSDHNLIHNQ